jgi:hypothetical protein
MLEASDYRTHANLPAVIPPGTYFLGVGVWRGGDVLDSSGFTWPNEPQAIRPVSDAMHTVVEELRKSPYFAIAGEAAWTQRSIAAGTPVRGSVVLRSIGELPTVIANPLGSTDPSWTGLSLVIAPEGRAELHPEGGGVLLAAADLFAPVRCPRPTVKVAPRDKIEFSFSKQVNLTPGKYRGTVIYLSGRDEQSAKFTTSGTLVLDLGPLDVTAGS